MVLKFLQQLFDFYVVIDRIRCIVSIQSRDIENFFQEEYFMNEQNYFKISEVAKLTGISRQTLIFYDKKNILKPAYVDDNDYRYYAVEQIHQVQIINMLKEFGIPLKEIKQYLDNKDQEELFQLFKSLEKDLKSQIKKAESFLGIIQQKKGSIKKSLNEDNYDHIRLEMREEIPVFCGHHLSEDEQREKGHFKNAYAMEGQIKEYGLIGFGLNVIVEKAYLKKDYYNHISYFCIPLSKKHKKLSNKTIPAGLYASTYHQGSNQISYKAYRRLISYIEENNLIIDGDAYDANVLNFLTESNTDEYLSEISIKVGLKET